MVSKRPFSLLKVLIQVHEPKWLWKTPKNSLFYLDAEGRTIKEASAREGYDFPLISGVNRKEDLYFAMNDLKLINQELLKYDPAQLSEFYWDPHGGNSLYLSIFGGNAAPIEIDVGLPPYKVKEKLFAKLMATLREKKMTASKIQLLSEKKSVVKIFPPL